MTTSVILYAFVAATVGAACIFFAPKSFGKKRLADASALAKRVNEEARKEAMAREKPMILHGQGESAEPKHHKAR